jgi:hypothetical protein
MNRFLDRETLADGVIVLPNSRTTALAPTVEASRAPMIEF